MLRRSELYRRWSLAMRRGGVFHAGDRIGVAVSGGPDSVLLLDFMSGLAREAGLIISVLHFNHHLRGEESDRDEKFVRELARERGLQFLRSEARVAEVARQRHGNLEATARELRYRYFFSLATQGKLDKVATAHTANDQAETVLLRLLRGTGTKGLGGIYPALEGKVVRPFLNLTRPEIEEEIEARKLSFRVDSSNLNAKLKRNKVRLELLPLIGKEYSPEVVRLLADLAARARDDEAFLEEQARERSNPWRIREGQSEKIPLRPLSEFPPTIARRVLRQMIQGVRGSLRGLTHRHVEDLRRFALEAQSGKSLVLPGGFWARKDFDWIVLSPARVESQPRGFSYPVKAPGAVAVPELGLVFDFKIVRAGEERKEYNEWGRVALDPQKLQRNMVLRNWREGDKYWPAGSRKPEKLKEFFRRQKIPREQRRVWPVLESAEEILWVRGLPPSRTAAASQERREVMVISETPAGPGEATSEAKKEAR